MGLEPQDTKITADDWMLGSRHAPVTLLEYGDFECGTCAVARPVLEGLLADFPELSNLVYRHFPVRTTHPHSFQAAEAAEAAGAQGRFWQMYDMLFSHQRQLEYEHLRWYADAIGMDLHRFETELRTHLHADEVRRDFRRGIRDGVNGTPTIFVNGVRYDGQRTRDALLIAVRSAAQDSEQARRTGTF